VPRGKLRKSVGHDVGAAHGAGIVVGEPGGEAFLAEDVIARCPHRDMAMGVVVAADATAFVASALFQIFLGDDGKVRGHCEGWTECVTVGDCAAGGKKRRWVWRTGYLDTG